MMQMQSSLGGRVINRLPSFNNTRIGKVTSVKDYHEFGRIEVIFLDYSVPMPVWVVGNVDREPVTGDTVLVGYMDGRKDAPYLVGFVKNESYTTNFTIVSKDRIRLQLPIFGIGEEDSPATRDVRGHLLDDSMEDKRAYIDVTPDHVMVSFPTSEDGSDPPATIKVTKDGVDIDHPKTIKHHGGSKGVARLGDTVEVTINVPTIGTVTGTGTITSASDKTLID